MRTVLNKQLGTKGDHQQVSVVANVVEFDGGRYRVRIVERRRGRKDVVPMSAEGIASKSDAIEMLRVFENNYKVAQVNEKTDFQPVQSLLKDV